MLLRNKVALITGSVRGSGAGIARVFAREGAQIVLNQVKDEGNPQKVLEEIHDSSRESLDVRSGSRFHQDRMESR